MSKKKPNWCIYSKENQEQLALSLAKKYPFLGEISYWNPIIEIYTRTNVSKKRLNHKYLALEIGETKKQINESSKISRIKVQINNKGQSQWRNAFIKEIPLTPLRHTQLLDRVKLAPLRPKMSNFLIFNNLYSIENSAYIEHLTSYLCSNLVENNQTIHFPYFYGSANGIFKTFTFSESDSSDIKKDLITYSKKYRLTKKNEKFLIKVPKIPTTILITENVGFCLGDILDNKEYCREEWLSYIFQLTAGLAIAQSRYKLAHNDLHIGNVMAKPTTRKFLYYKLDDKTFFRVPTFGKIIKIVDWGRALLNFNNKNYWNNCFNIDFDVFGQYLPINGNVSYKDEVKPNMCFDMTLFIYSLLNPDYNLPNDDLISFLISLCNLKNGKNIYKTYSSMTFKLYCEIAKYANLALPKNIIKDKIFSEFRVKSSNIVNQNLLYYELG